MINEGFNSYKKLIIRSFDSVGTLNKCRKDFICEVLILFLSIKGRINFLQLERFGYFSEQRYRQQFEKAFDFLNFNKNLILANGSGRYIIAFDPSYISKSGKHTPGLSWYWSGCAGKAKWGLEIGGLAAVDIDNHTAFHLEAVQTIGAEDKTLTEWYIQILKERVDKIRPISSIFVADAWFSKKGFVDAILEMKMQLISRLRDDAHLMYLTHSIATGKKGRPKKYDGKINVKKINPEYLDFIEKTEKYNMHSGIVYSKSLKRDIRLVHVVYWGKNGKEITKLYYSTQLELCPKDILLYYQNRFQIEFLYRDGKQFTGLCQGQARSKNKLNFHFNASLTAINIAKVEHWLSIPKEERKSFSMSDVKTMNHNKLLLVRFFELFDINPNKPKNIILAQKIALYGTIAP
jgi:hypothetical protein